MNDKLKNHAELTIKTLERFLRQRGWTTGLKKWEQELLLSAYNALGVPDEKRLFSLSSDKDPKKLIPRRFFD